ncbi:amidohydrolase [Polynucleobacter sp. MWH-Braz-FAM2G]|uniref:amidohydrolase n=1 Tax=Polynucleobacter sp. MWH-Braz-FAM2G TaxID=1855883 RepID=UPI001BFD7AC5|nr:amidohydrolase [Polynucleobacter sp. MWH-Braz-FAM2G]QWD90393.1 amidohydrolase [Polynucleobacter sp. MWH-Braz-FAM2G]
MHSSFKQLLLSSLLPFALLSTSSQAAQTADIVFINGQIETLNAKQPRANAVAVKDETFIAVGSNQKIKSFVGPSTKIVDLQQQLAVPGLVDAHTHPMETIWLKEVWVDARYPGTPSVKQALLNIAARVITTPKDQWIYVAGVSASENKFAEKRLPTKAELDQVAPNNPVIMANGAHMAIANSAALAKMGIKKGVTRLRHGAGVLADKDGEPNGVITDGMGDIPGSPTPQEIARYYATDIAKFWNANGFTSVMAITPAAAIPVMQSVSISTPTPNIRYTASVWAAPNGEGMPKDLSVFEMPPKANPAYYRFAAIKAWVDGENDCRTGYMYEPYVGVQDTDPPGGKGTLVTNQALANQFAVLANQNKKITMLHCSGDAAADIGLNAYEAVSQKQASNTIKRIEHFGMFQLTPEQLKRGIALKKNNFHLSSQPIWLLELVNADYENMGIARAKTGYQFKTMIKAGLEPAASTDMTGIYLGNIDPFKAIYATVTRQSDMGIFEPQEAITVRDALKMWTIWPAKAVGEDKMKGSIEVGKFADMTVLSDDIFQIPKDSLKDVKASMTIVGGRVVYQK